MTVGGLTRRAWLVDRIAVQIAAIERKYPERFRRDSSRKVFPGTCITVRNDHAVWIGDHYSESWCPESELSRAVAALNAAMAEMGVSA